LYPSVIALPSPGGRPGTVLGSYACGAVAALRSLAPRDPSRGGDGLITSTADVFLVLHRSPLLGGLA